MNGSSAIFGYRRMMSTLIRVARNRCEDALMLPLHDRWQYYGRGLNI